MKTEKNKAGKFVLRLKAHEFDSMFDLYQDYVITWKPASEVEELLHTIMLSIWQTKLYPKGSKCLAEYRLVFEPHEAQAFKLFWLDHRFENTSYLGNLLNRINYDLYQHFSTLN